MREKKLEPQKGRNLEPHEAIVLERAAVRLVRHHRPPALLLLTFRIHVAPRFLSARELYENLSKSSCTDSSDNAPPFRARNYWWFERVEEILTSKFGSTAVSSWHSWMDTTAFVPGLYRGWSVRSHVTRQMVVTACGMDLPYLLTRAAVAATFPALR